METNILSTWLAVMDKVVELSSRKVWADFHTWKETKIIDYGT